MTQEIKDEINDMKLQIGLLEKDVGLINKFCDKISESIEKIQELNVNFIKMISICEQRHNAHDSREDALTESVKELSLRLVNLSSEMQSNIARLERCLTTNIDSLKEELVMKSYEEKAKEESESHQGIKDIINQYKYMFIGGALVLGWVIAHIEGVSKIINLFK